MTVVSAKQKAINIEAEIIGSLNETDFRQGLLDYFQRLTQRIMASGENRKSYYVSYAQISSIILVEGEADDHNDFKINGGKENITLADEELPTIGTVTFR